MDLFHRVRQKNTYKKKTTDKRQKTKDKGQRTKVHLNVLGGVVSQGKTAPPPDTAVVLNLEPAIRIYFVFSFSTSFRI